MRMRDRKRSGPVYITKGFHFLFHQVNQVTENMKDCKYHDVWNSALLDTWCTYYGNAVT